MQWQTQAQALFPLGHAIAGHDDFLCGSTQVGAGTVAVMDLPAMARIAKVPEERLRELARDNPAFAPGAENHLHTGGLETVRRSDLAPQSAQAQQAIDATLGNGHVRAA